MASAVEQPVKQQLVDKLPKRFKGIKFGIQCVPSPSEAKPQRIPLGHSADHGARAPPDPTRTSPTRPSSKYRTGFYTTSKTTALPTATAPSTPAW